MKETIERVSEMIADNLLNETIIDKSKVALNLKVGICTILNDTKKATGIEYHRMIEKLTERKQQARRDAIEKVFWRDIAKIYIGENNMQPYIDRLNSEIQKIKKQ